MFLTRLATLPLGIALAASLAGAVQADMAAAPRIELRSAHAGWQVSYRFDAPVRTFFFVRNPDDRRMREWTAADPAFELTHEGGRDRVRRKDGAAFTAAAFDVPVRFVPFEADYAPFSPFGDGGLLIHSGRFHACAHACPRDASGDEGPWQITIAAPPGRHVLLHGQMHRSAATWSDARDGTMVYVGAASPLDDGHFVAVIDERFPADVRELLRSMFPRLMRLYAARLGATAPSVRPMLFASYDGADGDGRFGSKGGTLPGQVFVHLYGVAWNDPTRSAELRAWLPWFFAHEAAHLFQRHERSRNTADAWIHEGGAEAFAYLALRELGVEPETRLAARVDAAATACARGLAGVSLAESDGQGRFDNHYRCGLLMQLALDAQIRKRSGGGADLFALWRTFLARIERGERWSTALFLETAEPSAGPELVALLRAVWSEEAARPQDHVDWLLRVARDTGAQPQAARVSVRTAASETP